VNPRAVGLSREHPAGELGEHERDPRDAQPVPAPPHQHRDSGRLRDREEEQRCRVVDCARQQGSSERAQDAEAADRRRIPPNRERRPDRAEDEGAYERELDRHQVVEHRRRGQRHEEAGEPRAAGGERRLRASAPFVEPGTEPEQGCRAGERERCPRSLPQPPSLDGERDQEREADDHGDATGERKQAAAEQVFEVELAPRRCLRCWALRLRRRRPCRRLRADERRLQSWPCSFDPRQPFL